MTTTQIVRSWKDEDYFASLTVEERTLLPNNPAGLIELNNDDCLGANGGTLETITFCVPTGTATFTITLNAQLLNRSN
jgi:mersacidin/lichenicidin family type 2 lantibiotic